jgi:rubrerythrin
LFACFWIITTGQVKPSLDAVFEKSPDYYKKEDIVSVIAENLVAEFADELQQTSTRYARFIKIAEEEGLLQLAKLFRAIVASETVRSKLILGGLNAHSEENPDFFVCPHCGLIFMLSAPEKCPVDETIGSAFEKISE